MTMKSYVESLQIGPSWTHANLTVYPLLDASVRKAAYLTLVEALATGRCRIAEVSLGGTVPELKVVNDLDQPVLMLDGEELIGAKQNRVLNLTVMVPARAALVIPVSCVEAGRWQHVSNHFAAADRAQFARGRARKLAQVSMSMRETGSRRSNQSDVWDEIHVKAARMSVHSPTAAMAAIYEKRSTDLGEFVRTMPRHGGQVGAVFFIGGRIAGLDVFDCAETFAKSSAKLVRSYALDALDADEGGAPAQDAVHAFVTDVAAARVSRFKALGLGDDLRLEGLGLAGAALEAEGAIVHLVAFPASLFADERYSHPHASMARARRGSVRH